MLDEMCPCCLLKYNYKENVSENCINEKFKINYANLISETFNITISSSDFICKQCIKITQDAFKFKTQILKSQEELNKILLDSQNKLDIKKDDTLWDINKDEVYSDIGDYTEPVSDDIFNSTTIKEEIKTTEKFAIKSKASKAKSAKNNRAIREDSLKLLKYSNMCLFKSLKTKFQCYSCKETFINMSDLRNHSKTHTNTNRNEIKFGLHGFTCKNADISSLICKVCEYACDDLKFLRNHLENKHNIEFNSTGHIFVQYKLENGLTCVECEESFNTFVCLSTHMNRHSTNNVCEICGTSFINRVSLRLHISAVHREKKCTICSAKFEKSYAKTKHMKTVHNIGNIKRYCTLCDKFFKYSYKLIEHKIEEHGLKRQTANCKECGKIFISMQNLKIHVRSVHVKERNFECKVCGMRFFTKRDEMRHSKKHDDVKSFSCDFCEGKFKSKDSWRRHLKRLHSGEISLIK